MINFDDIRTSFESILTETRFTIPTQYENVPDSVSLAQAKTLKDEWMRVVIREGAGVARSIGELVNRRFVGMVIISLFYQKDIGTSALRSKASIISNFLVSEDIPSVYIRTPSFSLAGVTEDWFQGNITIPFEFDQIT